MRIFLNSYRPLIRYVEGQQAISAFHLPPYLDYSCRREPDFMSTYPSISALCRVKKFAPRLHEGDLAVYITCKGSYQDIKPSHWRLVAILEVLKRSSQLRNVDPLRSHTDRDGMPERRDHRVGDVDPDDSGCLTIDVIQALIIERRNDALEDGTVRRRRVGRSGFRAAALSL